MMDDGNYGNIFNIPHSIPSTAHPTAIADRTPTSSSLVESSKYLPAYGGMLELPGIKLKHNGLRDGFPFSPNPDRIYVNNPESSLSGIPSSPDCLDIVSHSTTDCDGQKFDDSFVIIRASGSVLNLDLTSSIPWHENQSHDVQSRTYANVTYPCVIRGLKYYANPSNYVILNFIEGVKIVSLSHYSRMIQSENSSSQHDAGNIDHSPISQIASFPARRGVSVIDSCLGRSQSFLGVASSDNKEFYIKIFDLQHPNQCLNSITKAREDDIKIEMPVEHGNLRAFVPTEPMFEEMQQIECDIGHLINLVMTTTNKVSQIDPRADGIVEDYMDRSKLSDVMPTEKFRRVEFSRRNDYQLYLMTNEKVRVIDKRFRSKAMNILDHMLDSSVHRMMSMKVVEIASEDVETLCLSANGRLCLMSFDQSHRSHTFFESAGQLVNPVSMHQPMHVPSACAEVCGLAASSERIFDNESVVFSTLQQCCDGRLLIQGFSNYHVGCESIVEDSLEFQLDDFDSETPDNLTSRHVENFATRNPSRDSVDVPCLDVLSESALLEAEKLEPATTRSKDMEKHLREKLPLLWKGFNLQS